MVQNFAQRLIRHRAIDEDMHHSSVKAAAIVEMLRQGKHQILSGLMATRIVPVGKTKHVHIGEPLDRQ